MRRGPSAPRVTRGSSYGMSTLSDYTPEPAMEQAPISMQAVRRTEIMSGQNIQGLA